VKLFHKAGQLRWWWDFTWVQHHNSDWSLHRRTRYKRIQTTQQNSWDSAWR